MLCHLLQNIFVHLGHAKIQKLDYAIADLFLNLHRNLYFFLRMYVSGQHVLTCLSHRLREKTLFDIAEFVFAVGHGGIRQWEDNALLSVFGPLLNPKHVLWVPSVRLLPENVHSL